MVDISFARTHNLTLEPLPKPRPLRLADGTLSSAGSVTYKTQLRLDINGHSELVVAYLSNLGKYDIILGKPWLTLHNPHIDWSSDSLTFNSKTCTNHCLPPTLHQLHVRGLTTPVKIPETPIKGPLPRRLGAAAFYTTASAPGVEVFSASLYEIDQQLGKEYGVDLAALDTTPSRHSQNPHRYDSAYSGLRKMENELSLSVMDLGTPLTTPTTPVTSEKQQRQVAADMYLCGVSLEDIRKALAPKVRIDPATVVPPQYHDHLNAFDQDEANRLAPHRDCDHAIELKPGAIPPHGPLYNMSQDELKVLRKFLKENLDKGFIRASTSQAASPVLFAKKPGGGLRFCVDYRALNAITIKNRYPLPLVQETLSRLSKAKFFTKLDVIHAFNRIRIREGDEWLTAFNTRYGLFESLVMPFGLSNAPATFQARINEVLRPFLDIFCTAYIDDILVYSDTLEEHRNHVKAVLRAVQEAGLQLDIKKCAFEVQEVTYLGLIVTTTGVRMDPAKVECITSWEAPVNVKDVQAFLGFSNFYRRFIKGFSRIVTPLVYLTKKESKWNWTPACQRAFDTLKAAFTSAPILSHFDPEREIWLETDASDYVSSAILSQKDDKGELHPVAFMSRKYDPAECNYEIYDKELLAIVRAFESWRSDLTGSAHPIHVLTDHRNLEYFMTTKQLTRRQVRWSEFLSEFDFVIKFRPGKEGRKPDSLTRRSQDLPHDGSDPRHTYQHQAFFSDENLDPEIKLDLDQLDFSSELSPEELQAEMELYLNELPPEDEPQNLKIMRLLEEGYKSDNWYKAICKEMNKPEGIPHSKEIALSECVLRDDRLFFRGRLYVPDTELRTFLLQSAHDSCESGHPGKNALYEVVSRDYWWPNVSASCARFVRNCDSCSRNTTSRLRCQGTLKPLPLPDQRWRHLSVDFVGPLPLSNNYDCVMVVADRLSKGRHLVACHTKMKAKDLAQLFLDNVWRLHGLPDTIVSDRGALFVSELWRAVCFKLGIKLTLSTAFHPETDGQTEIFNAQFEHFIRQYTDYTQNDWVTWLSMAEFSANNVMNASTQMSPFFANNGYHPRVSFGPPRPLEPSATPTIKAGNKAGTDFVNKMEQILALLKTNLISAQASQEFAANKTRSPAPAYRVGDEVFLDSRNIKTDRPIKKFDHKFFGRYKIKEVLGSHTYRLDLPFEHDKLNDSFHTNLLRPAPTDPLPGQRNPPPPPVAIDANGEKLWAIEAILDSKRTKVKGKEFQYLILWRGYDPSDKSWEPLSHVMNARASILEFEKRFPSKPRPTKAEIAQAKKKA